MRRALTAIRNWFRVDAPPRSLPLTRDMLRPGVQQKLDRDADVYVVNDALMVDHPVYGRHILLSQTEANEEEWITTVIQRLDRIKQQCPTLSPS